MKMNNNILIDFYSSKTNYIRNRHNKYDYLIKNRFNNIISFEKICFYIFLILYTIILIKDTYLGINALIAYFIFYILVSVFKRIYIDMLHIKRDAYG